MWRMRPIPTLSREWTYFLTLADLRADFEASGTELAEVEVCDGGTYARYGLLSPHGLVRRIGADHRPRSGHFGRSARPTPLSPG